MFIVHPSNSLLGAVHILRNHLPPIRNQFPHTFTDPPAKVIFGRKGGDISTTVSGSRIVLLVLWKNTNKGSSICSIPAYCKCIWMIIDLKITWTHSSIQCPTDGSILLRPIFGVFYKDDVDISIEDNDEVRNDDMVENWPKLQSREVWQTASNPKKSWSWGFLQYGTYSTQILEKVANNVKILE